MSLLFEVEDLAVASPATVSRAGMVYNDVNDLGWWPYVKSWLATKEPKILVTTLNGLFDKDLPTILDFIMTNCSKLIPVSEIGLIIGLCRLFDGIYGDGSEVSYFCSLFIINIDSLLNFLLFDGCLNTAA